LNAPPGRDQGLIEQVWLVVIPGSAGNDGCLTFDDEYPANLLFRATAAFTGLSPLVRTIEARRTADVGGKS